MYAATSYGVSSSPTLVLGLPRDAGPTKRVLHVINGEHFSGAERVQVHLAEQLPRSGYGVDLVCVKPDRFPQHFAVPCARLFSAPMRSRLDLGMVRRLTELIEREGPYDLLHAHTPRTALLTALASRRLNMPWVYHVHSPAARDTSRALINQVNALVERVCLRSCDQQITVSESLHAEALRKGWSQERVTCVPNGVPAAAAHSRRPATDGVWRLGMVALFRPRKGLEVLLEALATLRRDRLPVELVCVGAFESNAYEESIRRLISRNGLQSIVQLPGFTTKIDNALAQMDALVLPSLYGEGMPMVMLEAMSAGVPVVATRVEGIPEVVRHGIEGLLASPGNSDDLALQIRGMVNGSFAWQRLSESAVARHRERYSDAAMGHAVAQVYDHLLARRLMLASA